MSQVFDSAKPISGTTTFGELYQIIRDHDNALRSSFSGTSFPSNADNGQPCWRTDRGTDGYLYVYTGNPARGENGWIPSVEASDLNSELVNSRGTKPTLDQRLDVALNEDGTLKANVSAFQSEWVLPPFIFTYVNSTTFKVSTDQVDVYLQGRRVKVNLGTSNIFTEVVTSSFDGTDTTIVLKDAVLDATLVSVEHSIISPYQGQNGGSLAYVKIRQEDNITNMSYDAEDRLTVVTYIGTDNYDTFSYDIVGNLSNVEVTLNGVVVGNTVLTYSNGNLVSVIYTAV